MKPSAFWTLFLAAYLVIAPAGRAGTPASDWKEIVGPDEDQQFAQAAEMINALQQDQAKRGDGQIRRGFHAKAHVALAAEFTTVAAPEFCRYGIFKEARTYPAYVRFSNGIGAVQKDRKADARGFAIKVIGAEGPMLIPGEESAKTQDFLGINTPMVVARNTAQFLSFAKATLNPARFVQTLVHDLGLMEATRIGGYVAGKLLRPVKSLATEQFWSGGVVKLGPYAIKYSIRPAGKVSGHYHLFGPPDYLRDEFKERLKAGDIAYDFLVQFYVDEKRTPIEDAAVEWEESVSPFIKVGELRFRQRDLDSAHSKAEEAYVNGLSFSPWHCPADLRPLGNIQRSRMAAYKASAKLRGYIGHEPDGSEKIE